MSWITDEIRKSILEKIKGCEETINVFKYELSKYRDKFNTFDKFEASAHEYWRAKILSLQDEAEDLRELLNELDRMCIEEIKDIEKAEEYARELRSSSQI